MQLTLFKVETLLNIAFKFEEWCAKAYTQTIKNLHVDGGIRMPKLRTVYQRLICECDTLI